MTTLLPLIGALLAGLVGYLSGRLLENRKQLTLQKGQAYADYLKALATAATDRKPSAAIGLAADAKTRLCIYGSPAVIKALAAFEQAGAHIADEDSRRIVARLLAEMRSDMGLSKGRVDDADLRLVLFGPSERAATRGAHRR